MGLFSLFGHQPSFAEGVEKGTVKLGKDTEAILCGFGAGMTWGAAIVRLREGIC